MILTPSFTGISSTRSPLASTASIALICSGFNSTIFSMLHSNSFHNALYSGQSIHFPDGNIPKLQPAIIADGLLRMILLLILQSSGALSIFQFVLYDVTICGLMVLDRRSQKRLCRVAARPVIIPFIVLVHPWSGTPSSTFGINAGAKFLVNHVIQV